jgi:uncharacterized membrane protein
MKTESIFVLKHAISTAASKFSALLLVAPLFFAATTSRAHSATFKLKKLNPPGSTYSLAFGLNNKGKVVGSFVNAKSVYEGFIYDGTKYKKLVFSKSTPLTQANGINDSDVVVGNYTASDGSTHGFLLKGGKLTSYDVNRGVPTYIYGINNAGNFVGYSQKQGKRANSFVNIGGAVKQFTFQGDYTYAAGINNKNEIVGWFIDSSFLVHGFYRGPGGKVIQIDYPGAPTTECLGINDLGEITGLYVDTENVSHGYIRKNGKFRTVSLPDVTGINNSGVFVGSYIAKDKNTYGYIATPQ